MLASGRLKQSITFEKGFRIYRLAREISHSCDISHYRESGIFCK